MNTRRVLRWIQTIESWCAFLFLVCPILAVIYISVSRVPYFAFPPRGFSLQWYQSLSQTPYLTDAFVRSVYISLLVVGLGVLISLPSAFGLARLRGRIGDILLTLFLGPLLLPELILGLGLLQLYTMLGWVDSLVGVVVGQTVVVIPFMVRALLVSVQALDPHLTEVSQLLGADRLLTFRSVVLPLIRPGLIAACLFSFIVSFNQFTVTLFLVSFRQVTLPIAIFNFINNQNNPTVAAASVLSVLFGVAAMVGISRLFGIASAVGVGRGY